MNTRPARRRSTPLFAAVLMLTPVASARPAEYPPETSLTLTTLLEAEYLTPEERESILWEHGLFTADDIDSPAEAARAALHTGNYDDIALTFDDADPLVRAQAALALGDHAGALELLEDVVSVHALFLRARAHHLAGDTDRALEQAALAREQVVVQEGISARERVHLARLLHLSLRLLPADRIDIESEYDALLRLLAVARTEERVLADAYLAEAELLYAGDNRPKAHEALTQALSFNPTSVGALSLLGTMSVEGFDFDAAERIASRMDQIAGSLDADLPAGERRTSVHASILRTHALLRQRRSAEALPIIERAVERFPSMPEALSWLAATHAARFDEPATRRVLDELDRVAPGTHLGYLTVGRVLAEDRQYDPAAKYLEEAARRAPNDPEPLVQLGLLYMQSARDEDALFALERAHAMNPFNIRVDNSLRLVRDLLARPTVESDHFIVRFDPADELLAREMVPILERIHTVVAGDQPGGIDFTPERKTLIDLSPNHASFAVRIVGMPQIHTVAAATGPLIAMETPRVGADHNGSYDWERTVRHEYVHTVTLARTNNRIPHWFTEAAAVYLELAPRNERTCALLADALDAGMLFDFNTINLAFVRPERPTDRSQAYAQGHWMYEYIVERWGHRAPLELMDQYAAGRTEEEAFRSVLGVTREEFMERFTTWARDQVVAWGLALPDGVPSVRELRVRAAAEEDARAAEELDRILEEDPEPDFDELDLALAEVTDELLERWLEDHPEHPELLRLWMERALERTNGEPTYDMVPMLERVADAVPAIHAPHRLLASLHLDAGRFADTAEQDVLLAIPHLEFLDAREQHTAAYAVQLARLYASSGRWDLASAKAERAIRIDPYDADYRELAATVALQRPDRDYQTASRHLRALTIIEPHREQHRKRLAALERLRGRE